MPRYAIFLTPLPGDALTIAAAAWLGRDAFGDTLVPHPHFDDIDGRQIDELTHTARGYGFHGTLKAPFHLAERTGEADLEAAFHAFCDVEPPIVFPTLAVGSLHGFIALLPAPANPAIKALADRAVEQFDRFRRPASATEIARRNLSALSATQRQSFQKWGYPFAMEEFRYHMTLTRQLDEAERGRVLPVLRDWFAPALRAQVSAALAIFTQRNAAAPFVIHTWRPLEQAR